MQTTPSYADLQTLFADWREFESPPLQDGAPDYTSEQFDARQPDFLRLRERLEAFEIDAWPVPQQVDWHIVRAEMNGYDFNVRVLHPVITARQAKGLEFDAVVLVGPRLIAAETSGGPALYVALTRATRDLTVLDVEEPV
jgi:hypothetical protein